MELMCDLIISLILPGSYGHVCRYRRRWVNILVCIQLMYMSVYVLKGRYINGGPTAARLLPCCIGILAVLAQPIRTSLHIRQIILITCPIS